MTFLQFIKSKVFRWQLLIAFVAVILLIALTMQALKYYTRVGRNIIMPDLRGYEVEQIRESTENMDLHLVVSDSVFHDEVRPGAIVEQLPKAGSNIKKGRTVYLTINAFSREQVAMPHLVNYSLRNAKVLIESIGMRLGQITYQPSDYDDLVLEQRVNGKKIEAGQKIPKGTFIELIVGCRNSGSYVNVPNVIGMTVQQASTTFINWSLQMGRVLADSTIASPIDSLAAQIYSQSPSSIGAKQVRIGDKIDIHITLSTEKVVDALEEIENAKMAL